MAFVAWNRRADRQAYRALPLALVWACSLSAIGFWCFGPGPALELRPAAESVRAQFAPGDAWAVMPWWATRIREQLGDLENVQVRDLAGEDLSRYGRLWLLSLPGHPGAPGGPFGDGRYRLERDETLGGLRVRLYQLPAPVELAYDFRQELHAARVSVAGRAGPKACAHWIEDRWLCSPRDWNYVGRMIVEIGDDPREVIWAHPSDEGPLEIRYDGVAGGAQLLVHTGLTPPAVRTPDGAPVELQVEVAGRVLGRLEQPNRNGWFSHRLDLTQLGPGPHTVVFRIRSVNIGMRHFCFQAEVRR